MEPGLTTLRLPARRIGEIAADQLCGVDRQTPSDEPKRTLIPARLVERGSVGWYKV